MCEYEQNRFAERNIVHCLRCHKPQENLSVHLARVCMKNNYTSVERADEVQKARASCREWIRRNRTWDYRDLCEILPNRRSRIIMVKELLRRDFFIMNQPQESDMILDPDGDPTTADVATTVTSSTDPAPTTSSSVGMKMKEAGLNDKFPDHVKLLVDFKEYLIKSQKIPKWQQEFDNVSRFLRYVQPTASEPSLDFLSKSTETRDFLKALRCTDMDAASIFDYIKSIVRFLEYLSARLDLQKKDPQLQTKCQSYTAMLKTASKSCDDEAFVINVTGIKNCQKILSAAKPDFLRIYGDLLKGTEISNTNKTLYRYYCEALLVFRHMQCPGAVEGLTDAEWVDRRAQGDRVVIGVRRPKTSMQIALMQEEEACFQLYFKHIRPGYIGLEKFCQSFFVSVSGENIHCASRDIRRLHEMYKLPAFTSQDVRRAVKTAARQLPAHQQEAIGRYLDYSAGAAQPQDIVDAAVLLDSLSG